MRRFLALAALTGALASGLSAQEAEFTRPAGWHMRADRPGTDLSEVYFVAMAPGWHITTDHSLTLWHPDHSASGTFRAEMEVYLFDPQGRREGFGMFLGGADLEGDAQRYLYFLLREGGEFTIKERRGEEAPTLVPWTHTGAMISFESRPEGETTALNLIAVEVGAEHVRFLVNGTEVAELPRDELLLEGIVGMRVNHRLNLHVGRLEVAPAGGATPEGPEERR